MVSIKDKARNELIDITKNYGIKLQYIADEIGVHRVPLTQFKSGKDIYSEENCRIIYSWCKNYKKAMEYFEKLQSKDEE